MPETFHACFREEKSGREVCILTDRKPETLSLEWLRRAAASMHRTAAGVLRLSRMGEGPPPKS
jgi:hypothetical protein